MAAVAGAERSRESFPGFLSSFRPEDAAIYPATDGPAADARAETALVRRLQARTDVEDAARVAYVLLGTVATGDDAVPRVVDRLTTDAGPLVPASHWFSPPLLRSSWRTW